MSKTVFVVLLLISLISKVSKMSNTIVLCIQWPLTLARREGYLSLLSWGFSSSPPVSPTTRVIAGKTHSQSLILKLTKGVLSNPAIFTYLLEQNCILYTNCLPSVSWACIIPLEWQVQFLA